MKHMWWLIGMLTTFGVFALSMLALSADNQHALAVLTAMVAIVSLPISGLMSVYVLARSSKDDTKCHDAGAADRFPVFVIGNGSTDVRVEADHRGVRVFVGGPASAVEQQSVANAGSNGLSTE